MKQIQYLDNAGTFRLAGAENTNYLYFPLASERGLKSSYTPNLGGDAKLDQESFLLEPVSAENLHNNRGVRNFWCVLEDGSVFSAAGVSPAQEGARFTAQQDKSSVTAGPMWHRTERTDPKLGISAAVTAFIPRDDNVELMLVEVTNRSYMPHTLTCYGALPLYGRSADNLRDHRNVTSMLHRIRTTPWGVGVRPNMSFDERGHRINHRMYYAGGFAGELECPQCFYPTVEEFIGEGGSYSHPRAVYCATEGRGVGYRVQGREAMGAFRFRPATLAPGERMEFVLFLGTEELEADIEAVVRRYSTPARFRQALEETRRYWLKQVNVTFHTADERFDNLMQWVSFQPFLRRLFGCSFLPHHDYGRGGRGWRDLWQDCLSLLLMHPDDVGRMVERNFGGVRTDGTNATIIGDGDGNFIADRNGIARVWMDHAMWPLLTTELYLNQTGDSDILFRTAPYFKDAQIIRGTAHDGDWTPEQGSLHRTASGEVYQGTLLEHLLLQNLAAFYEVGEHNICRLRGADWNDALDMASERGESVAFTCAYAGNLRLLARRLEALSATVPEAELMEELELLLCDDARVFADPAAKNRVLTAYAERTAKTVTGRRCAYDLRALAENLNRKADWLTDHLRAQEWMRFPEGEGWFNSYYDNNGRRVEGKFPEQVRMMLTGQVFAIMSGTATPEQTAAITRAADRYLYAPEQGGYRLNTDFQELKYDMGRMFGFAYGEKENGAVFSHMAVMYANALYRRGFVREGWKALKTLADHADDFEISRIYPGIPEYFRADGRGMYHYLTGAASWYLMTLLTEAFGVRGRDGALELRPRLLAEQFDADGKAVVSFPFAGRRFEVSLLNPKGKDYGDYTIASVTLDGERVPAEGGAALLSRALLLSRPGEEHSIVVTLM